MKNFRISTQINLHPKYGKTIPETITAAVEFHKNAGFDALDFPLYLLDFSSDSSWRASVDEALSASKKYGIEFEICHLPFDTKIRNRPELLPEFNEKMHRAIDAAKALGVKFAVMHPNTASAPMEEFDPESEKASVIEHLTPFVEHAKRIGLDVVVENTRLVLGLRPTHRYCQTAEELCDIADALGIGVCWDFGHANLAGLKQSKALEYVGKRLKVLHVNDNSGHDDEHSPPFAGLIDWKDAMHGLALAGFDGLFNFELATYRIPDGAREAFAAYAVESAKELIKMIV